MMETWQELKVSKAWGESVFNLLIELGAQGGLHAEDSMDYVEMSIVGDGCRAMKEMW